MSDKWLGMAVGLSSGVFIAHFRPHAYETWDGVLVGCIAAFTTSLLFGLAEKWWNRRQRRK